MTHVQQEIRIELGRRDSFLVRSAQGQRLRCLSGEVWLTVERESGDVILGPGQEYRIETAEPLVLSAFCPSQCVLESAAGAPATAVCIERLIAFVRAAIPWQLGRKLPLAGLPSTLIR